MATAGFVYQTGPHHMQRYTVAPVSAPAVLLNDLASDSLSKVREGRSPLTIPLQSRNCRGVDKDIL
jgi:hypothetical protein